MNEEDLILRARCDKELQ